MESEEEMIPGQSIDAQHKMREQTIFAEAECRSIEQQMLDFQSALASASPYQRETMITLLEHLQMGTLQMMNLLNGLQLEMHT